MRTVARILAGLAMASAGVAAWYLAGLLIMAYDVGSVPDFWASERLLAYGLFILAPVLTFAPLARLASIPLLDLEAVFAWSMLLYVWTFVDPEEAQALPTLLLFLVPLTMSLATIFTLFAYLLGARLAARQGRRYDPLRARRQGYLAAMFIVGCLLLRMLEVLSPVNAGLLALIVLLIELLLLARPPASEHSAAS
ncbi:hypothetical protein NET02_04215 [Thermomicrobiaceae bacterium CFH 74404]|uniref:Uncharacterized protein n=1 Tax=Thermalbibacter longus TaxID=2951981 RepID=A0AA41WE31_9BACT|nr:hypothetical protein [Thermalbibacter longus]MCM8748340.1 hypothetical protein [Thermalbibacter longus]